MKVWLIKKKTIEEFALQNARSRSSFTLWITALKYADWQIPADIKELHRSADLLGNGSDRVVFNIAGNNYRMICKYQFGVRYVRIYVKWIGTHADYTQLCNNNEQFTVNIY